MAAVNKGVLRKQRALHWQTTFCPCVRGMVNRSLKDAKTPDYYYDTIPRLKGLAGLLRVSDIIEGRASWDGRVNMSLSLEGRLHVDILGKEVGQHINYLGRGCEESTADKFHAAFDVIEEVLRTWPALKNDLISNLQRSNVDVMPTLAQMVGKVFRELDQVGNQVFFAPKQPLPDAVLENIGNILIEASLPPENVKRLGR